MKPFVAAATFLILACVVVAIFMFWDRSGENAPPRMARSTEVTEDRAQREDTPVTNREGINSSKPVTHTLAPNRGRRHGGPDHLSKVVAAEEKLLSPDQRLEYRTAIAELERGLQGIEFQNTKKAYGNPLEDRDVQVFVITPPEGEQLADAFGLAKRIDGRLSKGSAVQTAFSKVSKELLDEYAWYPKANKVLSTVAGPEGFSLARRFATNPKDAFPTADGTTHMTEDEAGFFLDAWDKTKGWRYGRYSHLFEIVPSGSAGLEKPFPKVELRSAPAAKNTGAR